MTRAGAVAAVLAALLLAPPAAGAAKWRGETGHGRLAEVTTGDDDMVTKIRIRYRAPCRDGKMLPAGVEFVAPLDESATNAFEDGGVVNWKIPGGEQARGRASVSGGLRRSGRWTGDFRVRVRITKDGEFVSTCRLKRVGWKASPV